MVKKKINFRVKNNWGQNSFWVKIILGQKKFWVKKNFGSKNFWVKKNYWVKKNLVKKIWVLKFFVQKNLVGLTQGGMHDPPPLPYRGLKLCWVVVILLGEVAYKISDHEDLYF